jgi:glyoxylase-like metal-dependent hydrolase (beta-lactamase superfamily II)
MAVGGSRPRIVPVSLAPWGFLHAYLVQSDRTIVVDAGYPRMAGRIFEALERQGTQPQDVSLILLTHGHLDHLGGVTRLRERLDAPVALHRADAEIARSGHDRPLHGTDLFGRAFALFAPRTAPAFEPDIVHDGDLDLAAFGVPGRTMATPGHTPGSVSVVLDDAVICGDLLAGGALRAGSPRLPYFADDLPTLEASVRALLEGSAGAGRWHLGHRGPLDPSAVAAWLARLPEPST